MKLRGRERLGVGVTGIRASGGRRLRRRRCRASVLRAFLLGPAVFPHGSFPPFVASSNGFPSRASSPGEAKLSSSEEEDAYLR